MAKYDNTKAKQGSAPTLADVKVAGGTALSWDDFMKASARRGAGKRKSQYADFVQGLAEKQPVDATFVYPKVNVRTLRSVLVKQGKVAGFKLKTVLLDGRLIVARMGADEVAESPEGE